MPNFNPHNLDELIRSLEGTENTNHVGAAREVGAAIHAAMHSLNDDMLNQHFSLAQLEALDVTRRDASDQWEMPAHLSACQTCLESFSAIVDGIPRPAPQVIERFVALHPGPTSQTPKTHRFPLIWKITVAASVAIAAGLLTTAFFPGGGGGKIQSGGLKIAGATFGSNIQTGNQIPVKTLLEASQDTLASLPDGSQITLTPKTRFAVTQSVQGETTVDFKYGQLTASIAHQEAGKHFRITTPLGIVTVVGTQFTVTSHNETVTMFDNDGSRHESPVAYDANVKAVVVEVREGVVVLNNSRDQARVTAGQTAILRDQSPIIEVLEK